MHTNSTQPPDLPWGEIAAYVCGQMEPDAREMFERRVAGDPHLSATIQRMESAVAAWTPVDGSDIESARARMWDAVSKIPAYGRGTAPHTRRSLAGTPSVWRGIPRMWLGGAVLAVASALALFVQRAPSHDADVTHTYVTKAGEQANLRLTDGTQVILSPGSTLRLEHFGARERRVHIDGEAYFDVSRSAGAPFVVRSGSVVTRVLGTAFLIRHNAGDTQTRVAVVSGKVSVSQASRDADIPLTAGRVAVLDNMGARPPVIDSLAPDVERLGDMMVFRDAPLKDVLTALGRWYGYEFRYSDSAIVRQDVTVGLSAQSSAQALSTLTRMLNVHLTVVGDTITLTRVKPTVLPAPRQKQYDVWTSPKEVGR